MAKTPEGMVYASFRGTGQASRGEFWAMGEAGGLSSGGGLCLGVIDIGVGVSSAGFFCSFLLYRVYASATFLYPQKNSAAVPTIIVSSPRAVRVASISHGI